MGPQKALGKMLAEALHTNPSDKKRLSNWNDARINSEHCGRLPEIVQDVARGRITGALSKKNFTQLTVGRVNELLDDLAAASVRTRTWQSAGASMQTATTGAGSASLSLDVEDDDDDDDDNDDDEEDSRSASATAVAAGKAVTADAQSTKAKQAARGRILQKFVDEVADAGQLRWITACILRESKGFPRVNENLVLKCFHPDARDFYSMKYDLETACQELSHAEDSCVTRQSHFINGGVVVTPNAPCSVLNCLFQCSLIYTAWNLASYLCETYRLVLSASQY